MRQTTIARGAIARYLVRLRCLGCGQRYLAAPPVLLGMCPACAGGRVQSVGRWDMQREGWLCSLQKRDALQAEEVRRKAMR